MCTFYKDQEVNETKTQSLCLAICPLDKLPTGCFMMQLTEEIKRFNTLSNKVEI